jgi:hypothetical protein
VGVRDLAMVLADGGTTISDIEALRRRDTTLFGRVASEPTAWRTIEAVADDELAVTRMFNAVAATRRRLWRLGAARRTGTMRPPRRMSTSTPRW